MSTTPQQPSPPPVPARSSAAAAPTAPGPALAGNPLGVASLVAAILLFLWGLAAQALWPLTMGITDRVDLPFWLSSFILQAPTALLALVATILGVIALTRKGRRRTMAIIGTTLGVSTVTFVTSALFY